MFTTPFHIQVVREALTKRQRGNPSYSLRAYARDLGVDPSTLSQVLNAKRPLPVKDCEKVAEKLRLTPLERMKFVESALRKQVLLDRIKIPYQMGAADDRVLLDESQYRVIAEWEHYAVLTLADVSDFKIEVATVSERLGIDRMRAETVLQTLINARLLAVSENGLVKTQSSVRTTEDISSQALRDSHLEALEMGKTKLESIPVEARDFSSVNFAFDLEQMTELKGILREFRQKVLALARAGKKRSEVYQLALQLYPLTKQENHVSKKEKKK